ncbi:protein of unknown function [Brochothrix thermosphacta]|nr:hypothetical protein FM106_14245 [Brachybacterium faecium]SPN71808.1 protein of unknown function [Brochothrix thermosphacta]
MEFCIWEEKGDFICYFQKMYDEKIGEFVLKMKKDLLKLFSKVFYDI